jgi:hypothetical protein
MTVTFTAADAIAIGGICLVVYGILHILGQRRLNNHWRSAYYEAHETIMADLDRRKAENRASVYGYVDDAGGGLVHVMVERDTESYPEIGTFVRVTPIDAS